MKIIIETTQLVWNTLQLQFKTNELLYVTYFHLKSFYETKYLNQLDV